MDETKEPESLTPTPPTPKRRACVPCKFIGLLMFGLAGYGLYALIERFILTG